jgi:hypothetical protein
VVPEYDEEKVYVSDMLKVSLWYQILKDAISFDAAPSEENQATAEETTAPEATEA